MMICCSCPHKCWISCELGANHPPKAGSDTAKDAMCNR
ncbi:uncharacterized protein METZ01_LOCUS442586, partial [marine metagenome]